MSDDPTIPEAAPLVGGRYSLLRELGSGAMGVVWEAHDQVLDRVVALKELRPPPGLAREEAVERFLTEARAAARLRHPNIITVHDVMADGDRVLMALEFLDGHTLAQLQLPLDAAVARDVLTQVAAALAEAHANGVVHRDLKPENVFVLADGRAVVCDLGLARIGAGTGTRAGTVMGTPGYLAPEQVRGESVGPAADVFAWGAIGYELLSGLPAFGSPELDPATLLYNVVNVDPAPFTSTDPELVSVIGQSLSKDPVGRPPSGVELYQVLSGVAPAAGWMSPAPTAMSTPSQAPWNPGVPSLTPVGAYGQVTSTVQARGRGGLIAGIAGLVVAVLALVVALVLVAAGGGDSEVTAAGGNDDRTSITIPDPSIPQTSPSPPSTTTTTSPPPAARADPSGFPIVDGFFVVINSLLKSDPGAFSQMETVASQRGLPMVDTDGYQTGNRVDGGTIVISGVHNVRAGSSPDYWPSGEVWAVISGPFSSFSEAESFCPPDSCNVRQFRARF